MLNSPFDKTIAFYPDQVLTAFNTGVWESLRGMGSMVVLSSRSAFNGDPVPESQYWKGDIEIKSFGFATNLNAIYFDKDKDARDIIGLAITICGNYNHDAALEWVNEKNSLILVSQHSSNPASYIPITFNFHRFIHLW